MSGYGTYFVLMAMATVSISIANGQDQYGLSLIKPFQPGQWNQLGDIKFDSQSLLLTSGSKPGPQRGAIWNPTPFPYRKAFTIVMNTRIKSANVKKPDVVTGAGLALWLVEIEDGKPIGTLGDVYGSSDYFRGLAVTYDSIDDDGRRNNPAISAHYLDGTVKYAQQEDGIPHQIAGCRADYRRDDGVVSSRIEYDGKTLSIRVDLYGKGMYQGCFSKPLEMRTDRAWYLGISAQTIDSPLTQEIHEILSLNVTGTPEWGYQASPNQQQQQQQWQQPPPPQQQQQQQQQWQPPPQQQRQQQQQPPQGDDSVDTTEALHEKIDQLMKATTHTALESQQAGEALKEVQTNVLQKIQLVTNSLGRQIRTVDQSLAKHVTSVAQQFQGLTKSIESTKGSVDAGRVDSERRINLIEAQISALQETVVSMNSVVERLSKSFQSQISREFGRGTARMAAVASRRNDWSIWAFVILFQVVFIIFLIYRSLMKRKLEKLL